MAAGAGSAEAKPSEEQAEVEARLKRAEDNLKSLKRSKSELEDVIPCVSGHERAKGSSPHLHLVRGAYDQPGEKVERNTPAFLPPIASEREVKSRMDLARWLIDKQHPLTARVTVNRFWQQFFGVGLVKTSEDFGTQGQWPSHPGLLDDLTTRFVQFAVGCEGAGEVDRLLSNISTVICCGAKQLSRADPDNRLLARGSRFRMDAEMIRDQILYVSGLLNQTMYGRSVKTTATTKSVEERLNGLFQYVRVQSGRRRKGVPTVSVQFLETSVAASSDDDL